MIVRGYQGMGATGSQIIGVTGGTVATLGGTIFSSSALMSMLGISAAAGPVGIAVAGVVAAGAAIASALGVGSGCGQSCIQATNVVNQAEPVLKQNLDAYESGQIDQDTAQSNYAQVWTAVQQACGGIPGAAGQDCISDRAEGSCKWKQTASPTYPGEPALGDCWNWYEAYYNPLTLPALVPMQSSSVGGTVSSLVGDVTSSPLLLVGLVAAGVLVATS